MKSPRGRGIDIGHTAIPDGLVAYEQMKE